MSGHHVTQQRFSDAQLSRAALTAFFAIAEQWQLTREQERQLLGQPPRSSFFKWRKTKDACVDKHVLERISYIVGIYKALRILLPSEQAAHEWPHKPNSAPLFNGQSALDKMLAGNVIDLADVRRYLDAERGG
ncbi:MAG: MbcA/ParS/Xre antitoxin family protein [Gammaproteobacteria bacterium]